MNATAYIAFMLLAGIIGLGNTCNEKGDDTSGTETTSNDSYTIPSDDSLFLSLDRTPCYGYCPFYTIRIYRNGVATYEGKKFVDSLGLYKTRIPLKTLEEIEQKALEIDFFNLADKYPTGNVEVSDLPTTITYIKLDDREKKVSNKHKAPEKLRTFETYIDSLFKDTRWIKVADSSLE